MSFWLLPVCQAVVKMCDSILRCLIFLCFAKDQEQSTPLHAAAYLGDVHTMDLLIASGANVNAKDQGLLTPLHRAAASQNQRAVELLLKHGAEVNTRDKFWHTPLHMAAAKWAAGCALALIPHVCSLDVADRSGRTPLHHAAHSGHGEMVNLLLSKGANLSAKDKKERQAIHWAAYLGHVEVVKLLLSHSADVMSKDKRGYTPLHAASASGQLDVVKYLMRLIVEIDEPNAFGNTALHMACYTGQDSVATELVNCGANINQANHHGSTPLHLAAASSSGVLCLELLINNGADVNVQNKEGKSPLHMAAMHGRFTGSQIIIQNGAEIDCVDIYGNTPLHVAARYGQELLISTLLTNGADRARPGIHGMLPLHLAALYGFPDCCRKFLSNELLYVVTCLHAAASGGNIECLNLLLSSEAELDVKDNLGRSPLHYAAANGNSQCTISLVRAGAEVNEPDLTGCSPLHYAAASHTFCGGETNSDYRLTVNTFSYYMLCVFRCLDFLLDNGANPTLKNSKGYSAVHYAAGQMDCLLLLVNREQSADIIDSPDTQGQTALMLAALGRHTDCVHILLEKGANADAADKKGFTALHRAAMLGSEDCVSALLEHGASALCRDSQGRTPLHLTASLGHTELLRTLLIAAMKADPLDSILDYRGCTPTHWAAYHGHEGCLHILLENKLFSNQEGNHFTPLHCALVNGHDVAAELLVKTVGPQVVNVSDAKGRTPLHAAAHSGSVAGVQLVLAQGAEVNAVDHSGCSALMVAADCGQTMAVEFLLHKAKPDLTLVDVNNNTALHLACSKGHEMCALLILGEINDSSLINATNSALQMPLHIAARKGLATVVQVLLSRGAAVMAVDEEGHTPALACAPNKNVADCLALILSTMKPFPPREASNGKASHFNPILKNCGIAGSNLSGCYIKQQF
uniref:Ankyrin repeat domain 52 n=1 Tax=Sparus aurata TaxID=8175 RepID=A0A671YLX3_SPAAU